MKRKTYKQLKSRYKDMLFAITMQQKWQIIEILCDCMDFCESEEQNDAFNEIWDLLVSLPVLEPVEE